MSGSVTRDRGEAFLFGEGRRWLSSEHQEPLLIAVAFQERPPHDVGQLSTREKEP